MPANATPHRTRRHASTSAIEITAEPEEAKPLTPKQAIDELKQALLDLQKDADSYVNISRLQLALRSIEQQGQETVRIAIVALAGQKKARQKTRELVRLLLADPLKAEEEWERVLMSHNGPLLLRITPDATEQPPANRLIKEIIISSPAFNKNQLEILVLEGEVLSTQNESAEDIEDRLLTPIIDIPITTTGRYSPITTPVHKSLLVGNSVTGAASLLQASATLDQTLIATAVDLPGYNESDNSSTLRALDVARGKAGLEAFRENVSNVHTYEANWAASNIESVQTWLKTGTLPTDSELLKAPSQALISSILSSASHRISTTEAAQLSSALSNAVSQTSLQSLHTDLSTWSETAHAELRDSLDAAFSGQHWAALSWWKLFWRVDDVPAIASDMISSRFLPAAEQNLIFLAGKIDSAGVIPATPASQVPLNPRIAQDAALGGASWAYKEVPATRTDVEKAIQSIPTSDRKSGEVMPVTSPSAPLEGAVAQPAILASPWPLHIAIVRRHIIASTIPRLTALAQGLVAQAVGMSAASLGLAAFVYATNLSVGVYEAGAVAALGVVVGLGRMQRRWEGVRRWWVGEVREEGRRALVSTEEVVRRVLQNASGRNAMLPRELGVAKQAVERARKALEEVEKVAKKSEEH